MLKNETLNVDETKELHNIQLEMFKEFICICNGFNLRYFVIGGTALGAVRHGGFIPWDDDIDIGMPRKDYELFIEKAPHVISEKYFIQTHITDPLYPHNFAKIRDENTTFIEKNVRNLNINHGVYIDIFPLDGVSSSKVFNYVFKIKNKIYTKKINEVFDLSMFDEKSSLKGQLFMLLVNILLYRFSHSEIVFMKDNLLRKIKYDDSEVIANYCGAWGDKEIVPKSYFGDGEMIEFENLSVIIPEQYDNYLKSLYGKYMELPPVGSRVTHHHCSIIDLKKSYRYYFKISE